MGKGPRGWPTVAPVPVQVRTLRMHLFTSLQLVCLAVLWAVMSTVASLAFPFILILTVPLRMCLLSRIFTEREMKCVSGACGEGGRGGAQPQPQGRGASGMAKQEPPPEPPSSSLLASWMLTKQSPSWMREKAWMNTTRCPCLCEEEEGAGRPHEEQHPLAQHREEGYGPGGTARGGGGLCSASPGERGPRQSSPRRPSGTRGGGAALRQQVQGGHSPLPSPISGSQHSMILFKRLI